MGEFSSSTVQLNMMFLLKITLLLYFFPFLLSESSTKATATTLCPNQIPEGTCPTGPPSFYEDPEDCSAFWMCVDGCAYHQQCDPGMLFDMLSRECRESSTVECGSRPCTSEEHCDCINQVAEDLCYSSDFEEFYPDMSDCASFYNCTAGCFEHNKCPRNFLYSIEEKWCSYPNEIVCGERPCFEEDRCQGQGGVVGMQNIWSRVFSYFYN